MAPKLNLGRATEPNQHLVNPDAVKKVSKKSWKFEAVQKAPCPPQIKGRVSKSMPLAIKCGPSSIAGRGIFAKVRIEKATHLGSYDGHKISKADWAAIVREGEDGLARNGKKDPAWKRYVDMFAYAAMNPLAENPAERVILGKDVQVANFGRYVNHKCFTKANARFVPSKRNGLRIETKAAIHPGQEIFVTYGPEYWAFAKRAGIIKK